MGKFTDVVVALIKATLETGDQPTEAEWAYLVDRIQQGIEGHDHLGVGDGDAAQIPTAGIADNAIDDTKAGNRVLRLDRRQGGHATQWTMKGTTTYTPGAVRMQAGMAEWTGAAQTSGSKSVTFPTAFSAAPLVFLTSYWTSGDIVVAAVTTAADQFQFCWEDQDSNSHTSVIVGWLAIGSE